jgi:ABC-2 type transport system permease protein
VGFQVAHPFVAALVILLTLIAMVALGLFFAGFYVLTRAAGPLSQAVMAPVRFLSGTQFPIGALPAGLQALSYAIPVTFGLSAVRGTLLGGQGLAELAPSLLILVGMSAAFALAGAWLIHRMELRAKRNGTLHAY